MAGISSNALGIVKNKKEYNGNELQNNEFSDGSGLEVYDFNARTYDAQIGRFIQIDPQFEDRQEGISPYHFGKNNPILYADPDGRNPIIPVLTWLYRAWRAYQTAETLSQVVNTVPTNYSRAVVTNMVITSDAKGNTVVIPEAKLSEFNAQLKTEKVDALKGEIRSLERSAKSLPKNVEEHKQKDYKKDPDKYDNKGELKNADAELRQKKIAGRVESLEKQIKKNEGELDKVKQELGKKTQELKKVKEN